MLLREDTGPHHFYYQPFVRSNYWMRLLASPPVGGIADNMERSGNQSDLTIVRYKEFWGDQSVNNDILAINGVNVCTAEICPVIKGVYRTGVIGLFIFDKGTDGESALTAPIQDFYATSFMSGADLYIPAADPPDGTIRLTLTPRGGNGLMQVINVPNWASSNDRISVQFNDYIQRDDIPSCLKGRRRQL